VLTAVTTANIAAESDNDTVESVASTNHTQQNTVVIKLITKMHESTPTTHPFGSANDAVAR